MNQYKNSIENSNFVSQKQSELLSALTDYAKAEKILKDASKKFQTFTNNCSNIEQANAFSISHEKNIGFPTFGDTKKIKYLVDDGMARIKKELLVELKENKKIKFFLDENSSIKNHSKSSQFFSKSKINNSDTKKEVLSNSSFKTFSHGKTKKIMKKRSRQFPGNDSTNHFHTTINTQNQHKHFYSTLYKDPSTVLSNHQHTQPNNQQNYVYQPPLSNKILPTPPLKPPDYSTYNQHNTILQYPLNTTLVRGVNGKLIPLIKFDSSKTESKYDELVESLNKNERTPQKVEIIFKKTSKNVDTTTQNIQTTSEKILKNNTTKTNLLLYDKASQTFINNFNDDINDRFDMVMKNIENNENDTDNNHNFGNNCEHSIKINENSFSNKYINDNSKLKTDTDNNGCVDDPLMITLSEDKKMANSDVINIEVNDEFEMQANDEIDVLSEIEFVGKHDIQEDKDAENLKKEGKIDNEIKDPKFGENNQCDDNLDEKNFAKNTIVFDDDNDDGANKSTRDTHTNKNNDNNICGDKNNACDDENNDNFFENKNNDNIFNDNRNENNVCDDIRNDIINKDNNNNISNDSTNNNGIIGVNNIKKVSKNGRLEGDFESIDNQKIDKNVDLKKDLSNGKTRLLQAEPCGEVDKKVELGADDMKWSKEIMLEMLKIALNNKTEVKSNKSTNTDEINSMRKNYNDEEKIKKNIVENLSGKYVSFGDVNENSYNYITADSDENFKEKDFKNNYNDNVNTARKKSEIKKSLEIANKYRKKSSVRRVSKNPSMSNISKKASGSKTEEAEFVVSTDKDTFHESKTVAVALSLEKPKKSPRPFSIIESNPLKETVLSQTTFKDIELLVDSFRDSTLKKSSEERSNNIEVEDSAESVEKKLECTASEVCSTICDSISEGQWLLSSGSDIDIDVVKDKEDGEVIWLPKEAHASGLAGRYVTMTVGGCRSKSSCELSQGELPLKMTNRDLERLSEGELVDVG